MPWEGFEPQTLGVASRDEDHQTMPLPQAFEIVLIFILAEIIIKAFYGMFPKMKKVIGFGNFVKVSCFN